MAGEEGVALLSKRSSKNDTDGYGGAVVASDAALWEGAERSSRRMSRRRGSSSDTSSSGLGVEAGRRAQLNSPSNDDVARGLQPGGEIPEKTWRDVETKDKLKVVFCVFMAIVLAVVSGFFTSIEETEEVDTVFALDRRHPLTVNLVPEKPSYAVECDVILPYTEGFHNVSVRIHLEWVKPNKKVQVLGKPWHVKFDEEDDMHATRQFEGVPDRDFTEGSNLRLIAETNAPKPFAMHLHSIQLRGIVDAEVWIAGIILCGVYVLIVFELVHRTIAALFGSFTAVVALSIVRERPSLEVIIQWIEFETICLLFGMMVMVGIFSSTGFFEYCALKAFQWSNGDVWSLIVLLCIFTAFVSAFLDNVTTVLLLTPVTMQLCKVIDIDPVPVIIAEVLFSNVGGTATAIGDPPNVIIISHSGVASNGVTFAEFTLHLMPGSILATIAAYVFMRFTLRSKLLTPMPKESELEIEIKLWRETAQSLHTNTEAERNVRDMMWQHIESLQEQIDAAKESGEEGGVRIKSMEELEEEYKITDWPLFIQCSVILSLTIILFFLQSVLNIHLDLAWTAILGALALLLVSGIDDADEVFHHVEWSTLLFFGGLFIIMEALGELGLINFIGNNVAYIIAQVPAKSRLAAAIIIILWVSALVSAFIDNIPFCTAMIPVILQLAEDPAVDLPLRPLLWSLAFGACLGGNGTLIGASANVVACGLSEQRGHHISFKKFFVEGFPLMLVTVFVVMCYLLLVHVGFGWDN